MKFLDYLNEEFAAYDYRGVPVYKNPTIDDYKDMLKDYKETSVLSIMRLHIRGILDMKDKNLFVADGYYFTHDFLYKTITKKLVSPSAKTIQLEGHIKNGKLYLQPGDFSYRTPSAGDAYERYDWTRKDFEWCLNYFDNPNELLKYFNVSNKVKVGW